MRRGWAPGPHHVIERKQRQRGADGQSDVEVARRVFARARGGAGPVAAVDADAAEERGARGGGNGWVRDHPARVGVGGAVAMTRVTRGTRLR